MIDEQIKNLKCTGCDIQLSKTVPLCIVSGMYLCGACIEKLKKKINEDRQKWVQEMKEKK